MSVTLQKWISISLNLVDGNWAAWSEFGDCSAECGDGIQTRTRTCSDPAPEFDGKPCDGEATEEKACKLKECPSV